MARTGKPPRVWGDQMQEGWAGARTDAEPKKKRGRKKGSTNAFLAFKKTKILEYKKNGIPMPPDHVLQNMYRAVRAACGGISDTASEMTTEDESESLGVAALEDWEFSLEGIMDTVLGRVATPSIDEDVKSIIRLGRRYDADRVQLEHNQPFPATNNTITDQFTFSYAVSAYNASNHCKPAFVERFMYKKIEQNLSTALPLQNIAQV